MPSFSSRAARTSLRRLLLPVLAAGAVAGCTISQQVQPVSASAIDLVCIQKNEQVMMDGFLPELERLVRERGMQTLVYDETPPRECRTLMHYTANWRWDMAMYLSYARLEVTQDGQEVGSAEYDARTGGLNMGKFGKTGEKLAPLVRQLFPAT